ncbi:MAG TPA: hypothetical protein VHE61_21595 [Opitutaceae bacterium]|nr:hypothetical protein [Opitutaceae bacterium]
MKNTCWIAAGIVATMVALLSGCVGRTFNRASHDYMEQYAQVANRQLLLNIAQVTNNEPAYFIQIGNFVAQYSYGGKLSPLGSSTYTRSFYGSGTPSGVTSSLEFAPVAEFSYTENPTFNFTPLAGEAVTKAVFSPVSEKIFRLVYANYHADVALRTLVEKITLVPKNGKQYELRNDPADPTYTLFLAVAYEARALQIQNALKPGKPESKSECPPDAITAYNVSLADIVGAMEKGFNVQEISPAASTPGAPVAAQGRAYRIFRTSSVTSYPMPVIEPHEKTCPLLTRIKALGASLKIELRNFDLVLYRIGREDRMFREDAAARRSGGRSARIRAYDSAEEEFLPGLRTSLTWTENAHGASAKVVVTVPANEGTQEERFSVRPTLWLTDYKTKHDLVSLKHLVEDKTVLYHVGDAAEDADDTFIPSVPNQVEFTLLSYLFTQAAIDSTKLPLQQIVEVR